jgi:hypothetical protein
MRRHLLGSRPAPPPNDITEKSELITIFHDNYPRNLESAMFPPAARRKQSLSISQRMTT